MNPSFANPWVLWSLAGLPVLGLFGFLAWRWQRRALSLLGSTPAVGGLIVGRSASGWRGFIRPGSRLWVLVALTLLIVGAAGPRWGHATTEDTPSVSGRDLVIVWDMSRSMLAEQPSRQERARRGLLDLARALEKSGGHRTALVIFAAHARLMFPLTSDYDHLRTVVSGLDADSLPPGLRPRDQDSALSQERKAAFVSGTRIGAGLLLAVEAHEPRFEGAQDILLISDGDDPAGDDEWLVGAVAARDKNIPIHVVGVGDPVGSHPIPAGNDFLRFQKQLVQTRLHESPLREIARQTGGAYISAQTAALPLGELFRTVIEPGDKRRTSELERAPAAGQRRQQYHWFFGLALALLTLNMVTVERKRSSSHFLPARLWLVMAALILTGAQSRTEPGGSEDGSGAYSLVRRGNQAFANDDFGRALGHYEHAEERIPDPGLVAFNEAATLYRLLRFSEAEHHYLICLEDQAATSRRKARAYFGLGNCLVRQAQVEDSAALERAMSAYRKALPLAESDSRFAEDVRHNLELANLLWLRARATSKSSSNDSDRSQKPNTHEGEKGLTGRQAEASRSGTEGPDPADQAPRDAEGQAGKLLNLPDDAQSFSPERALELLNEAVARIERERRDYRRQAVPASNMVRDW